MKNKIKFLLFVFAAFLPCLAVAQSMRYVTYFPTPIGHYKDFSVTGVALLGSYGINGIIVDGTPVSGVVEIGSNDNHDFIAGSAGSLLANTSTTFNGDLFIKDRNRGYRKPDITSLNIGTDARRVTRAAGADGGSFSAFSNINIGRFVNLNKIKAYNDLYLADIFFLSPNTASASLLSTDTTGRYSGLVSDLDYRLRRSNPAGSCSMAWRQLKIAGNMTNSSYPIADNAYRYYLSCL
jgi:hypothetical protein